MARGGQVVMAVLQEMWTMFGHDSMIYRGLQW